MKLDAVCLEDPVHNSALEDLCLEEICLDDHCVSLVVLVHRGKDHMLYDHPELPGEGQPEDSVVLLLVGCFWVCTLCVVGCIGSPDLGSCVGHPALLKPPLNAHLHCGGIRGVSCCGLPIR